MKDSVRNYSARLIKVLMLVMLIFGVSYHCMSAHATTYVWEDRSGVHMTDSKENIPTKYKNKVRIMDDVKPNTFNVPTNSVMFTSYASCYINSIPGYNQESPKERYIRKNAIKKYCTALMQSYNQRKFSECFYASTKNTYYDFVQELDLVIEQCLAEN